MIWLATVKVSHILSHTLQAPSEPPNVTIIIIIYSDMEIVIQCNFTLISQQHIILLKSQTTQCRKTS